MIVCKNCGTQNAENESFCGECGSYLEWEGERVGEPEPVAAPAPPPAAEPAAAPGIMQRVKDAVGIGGHDETPGGTPAPPAEQHGALPAPPVQQAAPAQQAAPQPTPPPAQQAPARHSAPPQQQPAAPSPWPAPPSVPQQQQPHSGSSMVVPLAPAAPADRAAPTQQQPAAPTGAPAGAPTQPGAAPVRPGVGAVRPGAAPPRPRRRDLPPEDRPPAPGETICGYCAAGNAPTRKFCRRCGTDLTDAPVAKKPPWYKRIFAKQTAKAAPVAGARPKAAKQRSGRKRSGRARYYLFTVVVALIMVFVLFRSFWTDVYNKVLDRVQDPSTISVQRITGSSAAPGHGFKNLTDQQPSTYWAPSLKGRAVGQSVTATFQSAIRLVNIGVFNGPSDQGNKFVKQANVAKIDVYLLRKGKDPDKMSFTLKPDPGMQTLDIGESDVDGVRVVIRAVDRSANSGKLVALGELQFYGR